MNRRSVHPLGLLNCLAVGCLLLLGTSSVRAADYMQTGTYSGLMTLTIDLAAVKSKTSETFLLKGRLIGIGRQGLMCFPMPPGMMHRYTGNAAKPLSIVSVPIDLTNGTSSGAAFLFKSNSSSDPVAHLSTVQKGTKTVLDMTEKWEQWSSYGFRTIVTLRTRFVRTGP